MQTINNDLRIFIDGKDKTADIKYYDTSAANVRIIFKTNNKIYTYGKDRVRFKQNVLTYKDVDGLYKYFKKLASISDIKDDSGEDTLLNNYFRKISWVTDGYEILSYFLQKKPLKRGNIDDICLIFPFGINSSQYEAVKNAFSSKISIVQGPPGTGKTQTILNIISNVILNNKSVAIASNNNSAILNVRDKLKKYNLDFITALLGSKSNKEQFVESQSEYPEIPITARNSKDIKDEIISLTAKILNILEQQNTLAKYNDEFSQYKSEHEHFLNNLSPENINSYIYEKLVKEKSAVLFLLWSYFMDRDDKELGFFSKIMFLFKFKFNLKIFSLLKKGLHKEIKTIQNCFYISKIAEIKDSIDKIEVLLKKEQLSDNIDKLSVYSLDLLRNILSERFGNKKRVRFSVKDTYAVNDEFIREYPVILSTLFSLKNICNTGYVFDYLIVDEASQADLLTSFIAMSCAKNIVIVGDLKQLPNVITKDIKEFSEKLLQIYPNIPQCYRFHENSLLSSMTALYPDAPNVLLREHYRCHPKIIGYCNKQFYNDELLPMTTYTDDKDVLKVIKTVKGSHARGRVNNRQIDVIMQEILPFLNDGASIGVISPYRDHVNALQKVLDSNIEVDTVHKFQGREKDIIIFSTVDNEISPFVDDPNLINVAVSRAVKKFWLVCSNEETNENNQIQNLIKYIKHNNFEVVESKIRSIFDLLYKQYRDERKQFLSNHKQVSEYVSENLAYACIQKCIYELQIPILDFVIHVRLRDIVGFDNDFTVEENNFINADSHLDFVIYNKMNKKPLLAIEVDGFKFHKQNKRQIKRDLIKDAILNKIQLPLLRLSTTGSNEEQLIKDKIMEIVEQVG